MNRLSTLLSMVVFALISNSASAILIYGVNNPEFNSADYSISGSTISILNTSAGDARITSFGFDSDPNVLGLTSVSGTLDDSQWSLISGPSAFSQTFEFGVTSGMGMNPNLQGGFPNAGITVGSTGMFTFDLGGGNFNSVTNFFVRWQNTLGVGSDHTRCDEVDCESQPPCEDEICDPHTEVAEPGTIGLMSLGLVGLYFSRRRSR